MPGKTPPGAATLAARAARDARRAREDRPRKAADRRRAGGSAGHPGAAGAGTGPLRRAGLRTSWRVAIAAAAGLVLVAAAAWGLRQGVRGAPPAAPPVRQLGMAEWLAGHSDDWRVARLQENPAVLVIEFPNLAEQGAAMNRMAALLEKADAPRDRVLADAELADLIRRSGDNSQTFYQGHDYDGLGLARFYALVQRQGLRLNAQEDRVRRELLAGGLLQTAAPSEAATAATAATATPAPASPGAADAQPGPAPPALQAVGTQAVITFTATQPDDPATPADETVDAKRRDSILRHEASHGRFYTRPVYRDHCRRFWRDVLTDVQREAIRQMLARIGYNRQDEELMLNEAQAFLMNTPDERAFNAAAIGMAGADLAALRTRFWQTLPPERDEAAAAGPAAAPAAVGPAGPAVPASPAPPAVNPAAPAATARP